MQYLIAQDTLILFYTQNLRSHLFYGFLILSCFLFIIKIFLIFCLDQDVYSDPEYQQWILNVAKKYNPTIKIYGSLKRLDTFLFYCYFITIISSILQITIGLIEQQWSILFILFFSSTAGILYIITIIIIHISMQSWINYLNEKAEKNG